ncbi:MAG: aminodeoxychorismate/anthranilate synthase component II [Legionella sp.]|nr:aminodeoxychorismate/anthranilate synthase component II [Legionella sp.]
MSAHVLLIDHYDSFTQLIKSYLEQLGAHVTVVQSDTLVLQNIEALAPTHIVLSPGPGHPSEAPETQNFILKYYQKYPMLGVCLGHQCLITAFGGEVIEASEICHGKVFEMHHTGKGLFKGMTEPFLAARYHSLVVSSESLPTNWDITAWTYDAREKQVIMGVQHQKYALFGVQYHPEAILTAHGSLIFEHFLSVSI